MINRLRMFLKTRHGQLGALLAATSVTAGLLAVFGRIEWALGAIGLVLGLTVLLVADSHKKAGIQMRGTRQLGLDMRGVRSDWHRTNEAIADATRRLEVSLRDSTSDLRVLREQVLVRLDLIDRAIERLEEGLDKSGEESGRAFNHLSKLHEASQSRLVEAEVRQQSRLVEAEVRQQERARVADARLVSEIDAARRVHRRLPLRGPEPLLGAWALSPRGLLTVLDIIERRRPRLVVEFGSGASTVYIAALLEELGDGGSIVSLEHLAEFAHETQRSLEANHLGHLAEVRLAPLTETTIDGKTYNWYSQDAIADLSDIDLVLVDGPPGSTGRHARFPALPILTRQLSPGSTILLDDAQRDDERWVLRRWQSDHPVQRQRSITPDLAVLRLHQPDA